MKRKHYYSFIASGTFLALCVAAFTYHLMRTGNDKFSAIFLVILTSPWSGVFAIFKDTVIATEFNYEIGALGKNIMLGLFALLNTVLIYYITARIKR